MIDAKEFMQFIYDICALLNTVISLAIIDKPVSASATTPFYGVSAIIAANQVNHDLPIFLTFTYKLRLVIGQMIEEGKPNRFDDGRFAGTIGATDGGSPPPEIDSHLPVTFNVL